VVTARMVRCLEDILSPHIWQRGFIYGRFGPTGNCVCELLLNTIIALLTTR